MKRAQLMADAALLFNTAIWGATFVMVQGAVAGFPVFAFLALRFALAALVLLPFILRSRAAGAARSETGQSEAARSETRRSTAARSETGQSVAARSETRRSEAARSETGRSVVARSETGQSDTARSETGQSVVARSETGQSVAARSETRRSEAARSETGQSVAARSETGQSVVARSETGQSEAARSAPPGCCAKTGQSVEGGGLAFGSVFAARSAVARWLPGVLIGLALFAGYAFQTFGLRETTPAKAGFITGMSVALVPLGQAIFLRRPPRRNSIIGVTLATLGLALLSLQADLSVNRGDLLVLACAVAFAAHILLTGRYAPEWQPLRLAFVQILTVALLSGAATLALEQPIGPPSGNVWFAALFTGLLATALAFFIQSRAQQATSPTHTALIYAAEPVFAGLFSFLLIGEVLGPRQIAGSALILAGMVISEFRMMNDE
jgi:drug/metabolite transporter (DMT)-like permease